MAVAFDAQNAGGSGSSSSVSFSVTIASGASIFAGLTRASTTDPSSVTWNTSENLSVIGTGPSTAGSKSWCYYIASPTSGAHTFAASWGGNSNTGAGVWSLTGVDTGGTPYGTLDTWSAASGNPSGIDVSAEIGAGDLAIGFCATHGSGSAAVTLTSGTSTERFNKAPADLGSAWFAFEGCTDTAGTPTWTIAAGDNRTAYALAVNATGGAAANPKGVFGLALDGPLRRVVYP